MTVGWFCVKRRQQKKVAYDRTGKKQQTDHIVVTYQYLVVVFWLTPKQAKFTSVPGNEPIVTMPSVLQTVLFADVSVQ